MELTLQIQPLPLPVALDMDGVARVGGTRVTLDTVVHAFLQGATAEEIAQQYPSLSLSDIYATISFYLQNKYAVDAYLEQRAKKAKAVRDMITAKENTPVDTQHLDSDVLLKQVLSSIAELPPSDLVVVYETIGDLKQKERTKLIKEEIRARAKIRAREMRHLSREEIFQRFIDATDRIRAEAIAKGAAIEGEWERD